MLSGSLLKKIKRRQKRRPKAWRPPPLTIEQILAWADDHHARTGRLPNVNSGRIPALEKTHWRIVDRALRAGLRGLPGGSSLARLLSEHRGYRNHCDLPPITIEQILAWADQYHARMGRWPTTTTHERVPVADGPKWSFLNAALQAGVRGLPGGSSLARLLAERRGYRNPQDLPPITIEQILAWADEYHARTGRWPSTSSGLIPASDGLKWNFLDVALREGCRGLPGGSSLAKLFAEHRQHRNHMGLPPFTVKQILAWADRWHAQYGTWPTFKSGPIPEAPGETWSTVNRALRDGIRSLPGGSSLPSLLAKHRGHRNHMDLAPLTIQQILAWVDEHQTRTGRLPTRSSGKIPGAPGEVWNNVDAALRNGSRGLARDSSLARLLAEHRGYRIHTDLPRFTLEQILAWADYRYREFGKWPNRDSGPIPESPGDSWNSVDEALERGYRGLPGGDSLARLLMRERGRRNHLQRPALSPAQILAWADLHYARTGRWPGVLSGLIPESDGDTWQAIDNALGKGSRTLPGGDSLARLLMRERGVRSKAYRPNLELAQLLAWAEAYRRRSGKIPSVHSGLIPESDGDTWQTVDQALRKGRRGLPGGSSLAKLLARLKPQHQPAEPRS